MTPRTVDQNRKLWAMLRDVATQLNHPQAGRLPAETWKALFLEQLGAETRWYPSIDGKRMVPMHWSSGALDKARFSDLIELIAAYGSERGVEWSDPEWISLMRAATREEAA